MKSQLLVCVVLIQILYLLQWLPFIHPMQDFGNVTVHIFSFGFGTFLRTYNVNGGLGLLETCVTFVVVCSVIL